MPGLPEKFSLDGKIALVTGGGGLLGFQHGIALAAVGAHVYLGDIDEAAARSAADRINTELGESRASALRLDVTFPEALRAAHARIALERGGARILINNATIDAKVTTGSGLVNASRFESFSVDQWQFELGVGLTGAFLCSQVFGGWMAENGGGVILNIASDLSVIAPDQRLYRKEGLPEAQQPVKPVTYSVIKTALIGLTRYLAAYWAKQGVRVNALSPGGVHNGQPEEFITRLASLIPAGRMASADEYRSAVQFLCSDASSYLVGQNIVMDGGRSIL